MSANRLFRPDRLLGFSDGVLAIVITLLVLGLEVPSVHEVPEKELLTYLQDSLPSVLSYVVSFLVIGMYWVQHYAIFHYIERVNRPFVLLNGLFLLTVSFIPFPTGLQSVYRYDELAVVLFGSAHALCGLSLLALWMYATRNHRLISPSTSPEVVASMSRRIAATPVICAAAIVLSFVSVLLSKLIFLSIPMFYFSHRLIDEGRGDETQS